MNDVPLQKAFHLVACRVLGDVGADEQSAGRELRIEDIHQLSADFVGEVVEKASTINEVELVVFGIDDDAVRLFENLVHRLLGHVQRRRTKITSLDIVEEVAAV